MKKIVLGVFFFSVISVNAKNYINYAAIHTAVDITLKEKKRTEKQKERQASVTALEGLNKEEGSKLSQKVKKINDRLQSLGGIIDGVNVFIQIRPMVVNIKDNVNVIVREASDDPMILPAMLTMKTNVIQEIDDLVRYFTALVLSVGVVNQMKASDRKIMLDYVIKQVQDVEVSTEGALSFIRSFKMKKMLLAAEFEISRNRERDLIKEIIENAGRY